MQLRVNLRWRNPMIRIEYALDFINMRGSRGGSDTPTRPPPPLENHKAIGLRSNTGLDPQGTLKTTNPAFNIGPSSVRQ